MSVDIRSVRPEEYERVGALTVAAYRLLPVDHLWGGYDRDILDVAGRVNGADVLVAVDDEKLLGAVTFVGDEGSPWLEWTQPGEVQFRLLAVDAATRGKGIGETLVRACLGRADARPVLIHTTQWMEAARAACTNASASCAARNGTCRSPSGTNPIATTICRPNGKESASSPTPTAEPACLELCGHSVSTALQSRAQSGWFSSMELPDGSCKNAWRPAPGRCGTGFTSTPWARIAATASSRSCDTDREVVAAGRRFVALHQVQLLPTGVEPVAAEAEIGPRELREAEHVAIERERGFGVGNTDRHVVDPGWTHKAESYASQPLACGRSAGVGGTQWVHSTAR